MSQQVLSFAQITPEFLNMAGGKGSSLARMFQRGYPVPTGFIVLPQAFEDGKLDDESWKEIAVHLSKLRQNDGASFAVRSSALSEDSARASFAGAFESVLNVVTDEDILKAILTVCRSAQSERVAAYSTEQGFNQKHRIAVVVQVMVPAEMAGVLFTADPITGSVVHMTGNYVYGLGEQLVSGEANPLDFKLLCPRGRYQGPMDFNKYAGQLYDLAARLEKDFGSPQDIEWAVAKGKLYILQSRPITTLRTIDYDTYEVNESLSGDFIWTSNNVGEALPDVMTPFTWSLIRELDLECQKMTGYYLWSGNICGQVYSNISMMLSIMPHFGISMNYGKKLIADAFGNIPDNMEVPRYPLQFIELIKDMSRRGSKSVRRIRDAQKNKEYYLEHTQEWCETTLESIAAANSNQQLLELWNHAIRPYVSKLWTIWLGGASSPTLVTLRKRLIKLVGEEETNLLLSNFRGNNGLESLGPLVGIMKVSQGEMSREEYMSRYGHRSPHEFEMSIPYPAEDIGYLDKQIREYRETGVDVEALMNKQYEQYTLARERFSKQYPSKQKWLENGMRKITQAAQLRESLRSEFVKTFRVMRIFMLKLGELAGIGTKAFFIYSFEVPELLGGNGAMLKHLDSRRNNYEKYKTLPPLPQFIRGRFDPFEWVKSDDRRLDYYDPNAEPLPLDDDPTIIRGFAGAAGKIEGKVRVLASFDEGQLLLPGEILVASTTNVGWTPLFPRATAIITDIGAPLSHAAIVARELGIPAVVGCGTATTRLKTGDRVMVDGGKGLVHILG